MTRVIHTGDTHIGYQQYNSPDRRADFLEAFRQVATDAIADDVTAVVHAGDLFHDRRPGLRDLQGTVAVLRRLEDAGIPFLAIVGNHESKRDGQWLDLFADLGLATRLGREPIVIEDVAFYGLDFVPRSQREGLEYDFAQVPPDVDVTALVSHGLFEPFPHADWNTKDVLDQSTVDFDVVLLGDNHEADTATVSDTWVTYCGSTERTSASERDGRGYNVVTIDDGDVAITRKALTNTRDFVFVDVTLNEDEGVEDVRERIAERDLSDSVVIVTVEGEGQPIAPASIEEFATERGALIARVNDRRETPEPTTDMNVSFADPDQAVKDRLYELGLSDAARSVDQTVRDDAVVDANVRETVERRVRELLEAELESESEMDAFEPVDEQERDRSPSHRVEVNDGSNSDTSNESTEETNATNVSGERIDGTEDPDETGSDLLPTDTDEHPVDVNATPVEEDFDGDNQSENENSTEDETKDASTEDETKDASTEDETKDAATEDETSESDTSATHASLGDFA